MRTTRVFSTVCAAGSFALIASVAAQQVEKKTIPFVVASDGPAMFQAYCASCHGASGKGNGPAAPGLKKAPGDLTKLAFHNDGPFPAHAVLTTLRPGGGVHGSADMPVWGNVFREARYGENDILIRTYNLMRYLEQIQDPPAKPAVQKEHKKEQTARPGRITDVRADSGADMYRSYCASCHGMDGRGDGPSAASLKSMPTDLTKLRGSDGNFPIQKVQNLLSNPGAGIHGSTEMPVWGALFLRTNEGLGIASLRAHNLTRYIESIQR